MKYEAIMLSSCSYTLIVGFFIHTTRFDIFINEYVLFYVCITDQNKYVLFYVCITDPNEYVLFLFAQRTRTNTYCFMFALRTRTNTYCFCLHNGPERIQLHVTTTDITICSRCTRLRLIITLFLKVWSLQTLNCIHMIIIVCHSCNSFFLLFHITCKTCILLKYICLGECYHHVLLKKRPQSCTVVQICLIQPAVLNPYTLCMNRIFFPDMHIAHRHNQLNSCIHTTWLETRTRIYCKSI